MKIRWAVGFSLLAAAILLASGCKSAITHDPKLDFITIHHETVTMDANFRITGTKKGDIWVGDTRDHIISVVGGQQIYSGVWEKYDENKICVCMTIDQINKTTMYGTSINSNYKDLIPAYSKDPDIKVELDTKEKVIFSKVIDGVKYTVTYRNYPNSGDVKTITLTNADKFTETEENYYK